MVTFATTTELNILLGTQESKANTGPAGDMAVNAATANIISAIGWDPRQSERVLVVDAGPMIMLPARNVTALAIASETATAVPANVYTWDVDGRVDFLYAWRQWGRRLTVTLTAGWPDGQLPDVFKTICLEEAARWLDSRGQRLKSHTWSQGTNEQEGEVFDPAAANLNTDPRLEPYRSPLVA
jgi:hypothetical protein